MTREELILKAKEAKSAKELLVLAKENGIEMTEESAKAYFEQLHKTGEVSDDELGNVSGGGCHTSDGRLVVTVAHYCKYWTCKNHCYNRDVNGIYRIDEDSVLREHHCNYPYMSITDAYCNTCEHMSYEDCLWLCNNPKNKN